MRCEEQLWPDCGGPSNTFLPPHAVRGGKATQTYSFQGFRPKLKATVPLLKLIQFHDVSGLGPRVKGMVGGSRVPGSFREGPRQSREVQTGAKTGARPGSQLRGILEGVPLSRPEAPWSPAQSGTKTSEAWMTCKNVLRYRADRVGAGRTSSVDLRSRGSGAAPQLWGGGGGGLGLEFRV